MNELRIGLIGHGNIGQHHADNLLSGKIRRARLAAVADIDPVRLALLESHPEVRCFATGQELIDSGAVDAVIVSTPHYDHTISGIAVLNAGLHLLVEKPLSVHKADAERLLAAHQNPRQIFAIMFNQRTSAQYRKVKSLIDEGELGELVRVTWIITTWFRTEAYYSSSGWRATWGGEGGGVLMNQCVHQLDLLQSLCGLPVRVRGYCKLGKWHDIEVEDEVTAYLEYANGASGVFITSTGEAPGTNRLEICGQRGRIIVEDDQLRWTRNEAPSGEFIRTCANPYARPPAWTTDIPCDKSDPGHAKVLQNFVNAILDGEPLVAPAREGLRAVELTNAILYSSLTDKTAELPIDAAAYERMLKKLIRESKAEKRVVKPVDAPDPSLAWK